ncbi:4'-phosphopantetheinyl transferase superfamily protein [Planktomarina sp.]|nr:4'-phosphopantetheinyl transferase superfamily protein [Planktomarina sp.]
MDMQKAKSIIAHFSKVEVDEIDKSTVMNHTVVPSSLLLHRMYAALANEGYIVEDPTSIVTYGDFLTALSINTKDFILKSVNTETISNKMLEGDVLFSSGIDIEEISLIKNIEDHTSDPFIQENFSKEEIEFCMSKPNPRQSFAGLFSAKEAIVKADHSFKKTKFNKMNIIHDVFGKPMFKDFSISISHSAHHVVAIAIKVSAMELQLLMVNEIKQAVKLERKRIAKFFTIMAAVFLICINLIFWALSYDFY